MKDTWIQIWKNKGKIAEGIMNSVFKREDVEEVSQARTKVCKGCEYYDMDGTHCAVPGTEPCCSHCGCSLIFKTRSLSSSCPINKWNAVLTEDEEILLNEKLNND